MILQIQMIRLTVACNGLQALIAMLPEDEVLGAVGLTEMVVRPGDTSVAIGIGDLTDYCTHRYLINLMEHAAILSLDLYLEPGETTIPVSVEFISLITGRNWCILCVATSTRD
jgi:hypothetical protein